MMIEAELRYTASDFEVRSKFGMSSFVVVEGFVDPVSLQTNGKRKREFKAALSEAIRLNTDRIFLGDVSVELDWYVPLERRYGTHIVADLDNIFKPLLDSTIGPNGIMVDDNQVQKISSAWLDVDRCDHKFTFRITANDSNEFLTREDLIFVKFDGYGCWPLHGSLNFEQRQDFVATVYRAICTKEKLMSIGIEPFAAGMSMPIQRFFPKATVRGFTVQSADDFLTEKIKTEVACQLMSAISQRTLNRADSQTNLLQGDSAQAGALDLRPPGGYDIDDQLDR